MKRSDKQLSKNQVLVRTLLGVLALAVAIFAIVKFADKLIEDEEPREQRQSIDESSVRLNRIQYNGVTYVENPDITTILILGVDKDDKTQIDGYRNGGQADFILLVAVDARNKTVSRLQIDRDTVTEIPNMSVLGKRIGTRTGQVALAHNFGATPEENNAYTVESVQALLEGAVKVDVCTSFYLGGISEFNDALGGVPVKIEDDFSAFSDAMPIGETVTLQGSQAELFTRSRSGVGQQTNEERMKKRQAAYMTSALDIMIKKCREDANFAMGLLDSMFEGNYFVSSVSTGRLVNEINAALGCTILPTEYIEGSGKVGLQGFMEFTPREDWITEWVLRTYYVQENR